MEAELEMPRSLFYYKSTSYHSAYDQGMLLRTWFSWGRGGGNQNNDGGGGDNDDDKPLLRQGVEEKGEEEEDEEKQDKKEHMAEVEIVPASPPHFMDRSPRPKPKQTLSRTESHKLQTQV